VVPFAEALHVAEREMDTERAAALRVELIGRIGAVVPLAELRVVAFEALLEEPIRWGMASP